MSPPDAIEKLIQRDRAIVIAGLTGLCALAWGYLLLGAGMGTSALEMTRAALFPHQHAGPSMAASMSDSMSGAMPGMGAMSAGMWSAGMWTLMIAMWWVMMIAMMAPSAAPAILLYARVHRHASAKGQIADTPAPTAAFAGGYLLVWLGFSIAATGAHWGLERAGLISSMQMWSASKYLSAGVLLAAGAYQLSPLKRACLAHCRAPAQFISQHWRADALGALRMGAIHGGYCVGCCWALMALLFVGGVMNFIWIAALAALVLAEKAFPAGTWIGRAAGLALLAWGAATLMR